MKKQQHGLSHRPEYRAWQTMRLRCSNPKNAAFPSYGGRGITVCAEWQNDAARFVADMGPKPSPKHELDRIDNDKGYSPANCRWVLRKVNDRNRRSNRMVTLGGESKSVAEWCEIKGRSASTVTKRLDAGWSPERAFESSVRSKLGDGQLVAKVRVAREQREASRKLPAGVKSKRGQFVARIRIEGKEKHLGSYSTPEGAHAAYLDAKAAIVRANFQHEQATVSRRRKAA